MIRRLLSTVAIAITFAAALPAEQPPVRPETSPVRPNILVILTDDQGWADIGYHESEIRTPNLDRLAAGGVRLEQHYVYATCSPTRVALLSGRYPSRFGVLAPLGETTHMTGADAHLPQTLQAAGYRTHLCGKWHIGETPPHRPLGYGFDTTYGYLRGQIDPYTHRYKFGDHVTWHRNDEFIEEQGHVTDLIADEAIRVIESSGEEPFFLYVAHHSPHAPLNEPPEWIAPYEDSIEDTWRRHFAAAVTHVDHTVGQLVDALERNGKRDNTLIIFSSDNGGQRQWSAPPREYNGRYAPHTTLGNNQPLRGWKGDLYEGGIRVPAFVHWAGVLKPGGVVRWPTHTSDWAATLIELAGAQPAEPLPLDGINIWPLISDPDEQPQDRTLYWRAPRAAAIREGDWKLITDRNHQNPELFNLADDPHEQRDLAKQHPERVEALTAILDEHRAGDWAN